MADTSAFEKMEFDGWGDPDIAKGYADGFAVATRVVAGLLADAVAAGPGKAILDLCTGHGVVAAELVRRGASVTGLDFSAAMLELAQAAVPEAEFVQGDALAMEFADGSFDAVTIGFGVPHFPDPLRGLKEAARVLKPGGRIAFSIWQGKGSAGSFGWLFDAVERLGDPNVTLPAGPDAHQLADPAIARTMVGEAGFSDVVSGIAATEMGMRNPEDLFDAFYRGAVRAASLLGGQSKDRRDAIRADLAARTLKEGRLVAGMHLVPAPAAIVTAVRK